MDFNSSDRIVSNNEHITIFAMPLLLIAIVAIVAYLYFRAKTKHLSEEERKIASKKWLLGGGLVILALLAFTRGQVIIGAIASLVALVMRGLPLLKYFPILKGLFGQASASTQERSPVDASQSMTVKQAADILGVGEGADEEEIIAAHKRLMQKMHPDKGGSEALAAQINEARKVLLGLDS